MADLNQISTLLNAARTDSTAFQSIVVTTLQILDTIHQTECMANQAALSLGQQVKVQQKIDELEGLQSTLNQVLSKQGRQILSIQQAIPHDKNPAITSWWHCVNSVVETLSMGIDCIGSIIKSQPKESTARSLGYMIIDILSDQHQAYLAETDKQLINE